jgi:hypothetical protein
MGDNNEDSDPCHPCHPKTVRRPRLRAVHRLFRSAVADEIKVSACRSEANDALFFAALENGHTVGNACRAAGYTRQVAYRWRQQDPVFGEKWRAAGRFGRFVGGRGRPARARRFDEPVFRDSREIGQAQIFRCVAIGPAQAVQPERYGERKVRSANDPRQVTIVIRDFEAEGLMIKLVKENRLSPRDLPPGLQARLQEQLAISDRGDE